MQVGKLAASEVRQIEYKLEEDLMSFGRGFTMLGEELEVGGLGSGRGGASMGREGPQP